MDYTKAEQGPGASVIYYDDKGKITAYLIDGFGWIMKKEAIELTNLKKIDAVIVKRGQSVFLRSRPNKIQSDNLDSKV